MAKKERVTLALELDTGVTKNGKPITKRKAFTKVNLQIDDQAMLRGAQSLTKLFDENCVSIKKIEVTPLMGGNI